MPREYLSYSKVPAHACLLCCTLCTLLTGKRGSSFPFCSLYPLVKRTTGGEEMGGWSIVLFTRSTNGKEWNPGFLFTLRLELIKQVGVNPYTQVKILSWNL